MNDLNIRPRALGSIPLTAGEIHVWSFELDPLRRWINSFFDLLSCDEKERARRFVFARDRDEFIAARGLLRRTIGRYIGVEPSKVRFSYDRLGKPRLSDALARIRFNISHSRGLALIAIARDQEVGIDVELVDRKFDIFSVADSAFSAAQVERLRSLPSDLQTEEFFAVWTRKEACLKAMGDGLSSSSEAQSAVNRVCERDACFMKFVDNNLIDWSLTALTTPSGYKGALAVQGTLRTVRYLDNS